MSINPSRHMQVEDIALVVYASLVQKLHTYGSDDSDRRKLATQSFLYADAFLAALDARPEAMIRAPTDTLRASQVAQT
jgi:hypothetical protein